MLPRSSRRRIPATSRSSGVIEGLLSGGAPDSSIWHAWPGGIHSLCRANGVGRGRDFVGLDYYTNLFGLLNFLEAEVAGRAGQVKIVPSAWKLAEWRWSPTHLRGRWAAGTLVIELRAALSGPDDGVVELDLRNEGAQPFTGRLTILGDENLDTMGDWGKYALEGRFRRMGRAVVASKTVRIGEYSDSMPWLRLTESRGLIPWRWYRLHSFFAVALADPVGWRQGVRKGMPHPERKRVRLQENQVNFAPEAVQGQDRWWLARDLRLAPGESFRSALRVAFRDGRGKRLGAAELRSLARRALRAPPSVTAVVRRSTDEWRERLASVPAPRGLSPENTRLYYKAWVALFSNLLPPHHGGIRVFRTPVFSTNKVSSSFLAPCAWESVLGSLLLGLVDIDLAARTLDGIIGCVEEDGVFLEDLGYGRASTLPNILALAAFSLSRRGMHRSWLAKWYTRLKLSWKQQYRYPTWKRLGIVMCRNYFYAWHNGAAILNIAKALKRPKTEIADIEYRLKDIRLSAQAFWNPAKRHFHSNLNASAGLLIEAELLPGTNGELLVGLLGETMTPEQKRLMLSFIRKQLLHGAHMVANVPRNGEGVVGGTTPGSFQSSQADFAIKPSAYLLLWPALRELDRDLLHRAVDRTLAGIAVSGDFAENYRLDGRMAHNHPMSFFGIFAVIWSVLCDDRYAPRGLRVTNWL